MEHGPTLPAGAGNVAPLPSSTLQGQGGVGRWHLRGGGGERAPAPAQRRPCDTAMQQAARTRASGAAPGGTGKGDAALELGAAAATVEGTAM